MAVFKTCAYPFVYFIPFSLWYDHILKHPPYRKLNLVAFLWTTYWICSGIILCFRCQFFSLSSVSVIQYKGICRLNWGLLKMTSLLDHLSRVTENWLIEGGDEETGEDVFVLLLVAMMMMNWIVGTFCALFSSPVCASIIPIGAQKNCLFTFPPSCWSIITGVHLILGLTGVLLSLT